MKNKKFIAIGLIATCAAVLIGVAVLNNKPEPEFTPEVVESATQDSWKEKYPQNTHREATLQETETALIETTDSEKDATQLPVTEEPEKVITELTPPTDKKEVQENTKPDSPPADSEKTSDDQEKGEAAYQDPSQPPASEPTGQKDNGHEGQVYDPVFGWLTPSPVEGQITDNDGDINKQVGTMD